MDEMQSKLYQEQFGKATALDESAGQAFKNGKLKEASTLYDRAADMYSEAARILVDMGENCDPQERTEFESVNRLITVAREMRSCAKLCVSKDIVPCCKPSKNRLVRPIDDEEDDIQFLPVQDIPAVTFEDIVGLADVKQRIMEEIINPLLHEDVYKRFHVENNGGLLLFGPPGSGKTTLARAVASQANMPFFSVRCSDIVGKYFGEAEKHVRALFAAAREARNCVVFLDEAEALACRRGGNSTVMNRLVPELLSQMDGFERFDGHIIVIFATNRPYDLDPAFLRPGRLSTHCYVPLPDLENRRTYLQKAINNLPCEGEIDIEALVRVTDRFSCADLANLIKRGCHHPINRTIERKNNGNSEAIDFLRQIDIDKALAELHPSVDPADISRLEKWMQKFGMKYDQVA